MIVTITLNPSIDRSVAVEALLPDAKLRCATVVDEPGGGGINVSRALNRLGSDNLAICTAGGYTGPVLRDLLDRQEIRYHLLETSAATRQNLTVFDNATENQYRFILPYDDAEPMALDGLQSTLEALDPAPSFIVASGSLPQGMDSDAYCRIGTMAKNLGARYVVDTTGKPLAAALESSVYLVKPNLAELSSLVGKNELEEDAVAEASLQLIRDYPCEIVVVSVGASGAYFAYQDSVRFVPAPIVKKRSTVGAGDSMVAGIVHSLAANRSILEAVQLGVACGTAATMNPGSQLFDADTAHRLYDWLQRN